MRINGLAAVGAALLLSMGLGSAVRADAIHDAARNGDAARLKALLTENRNLVNQAQYPAICEESTPLYYAIEGGRKEAVEVLLAFGADLNARSQYGTALHLAIWNDHADVAELLLSRGANLDIFAAAGLGKMDELKRMLKDDDDTLVNAPDAEERTPLHWAAMAGRKDAAEFLLDKGAKASARAYWDDTPLHYAARAGRNNVVQLLIDHGAELDVQNSSGRTPLHEAVFGDNLEGAKLLIANGADVNARESREHPVNAFGGASGGGSLDTPLHVAARHGKADMIDYLTSAADQEARDSYGSTPLHAAVGYDKAAAVRILLNHNANVDARDKHNQTPLHWAASAGHVNVAKLLIAGGADVNAVDQDGKTPLGCADQARQKAMVELLRSSGGK